MPRLSNGFVDFGGGPIGLLWMARGLRKTQRQSSFYNQGAHVSVSQFVDLPVQFLGQLLDGQKTALAQTENRLSQYFWFGTLPLPH